MATMRANRMETNDQICKNDDKYMVPSLLPIGGGMVHKYRSHNCGLNNANKIG
jgi:hypothetical protein